MIDIPEGARLASFDVAKLERLWNTLRQFDSLWTDEDSHDKEVFYKNVLSYKTVILETDGGMMFIRNIKRNHEAEGNFTFWDHKLAARKELIKDCIVWAFLEFGLERMEVYSAGYAHSVHRLIKKHLGFKLDGVLRNKLRKGGKFHDIHCYSLLREEVLDGS